MELTGTVKAIIYRSEDTGFTVLELTDETGEDMTAIGEMPLAGVGERVELTGQWTEHKTYGHQFRAETCKTLAPATLTALKNYLASGLIKGVGESTAQAIVQTFGMETLDVLEKEPARLAEVPGIGQIRAQTIGASYGAQLGLREDVYKRQGYAYLGYGFAGGAGPVCLRRSGARRHQAQAHGVRISGLSAFGGIYGTGRCV